MDIWKVKTSLTQEDLLVSLRVGLIVRVYQITIVTGERGYDAYASCLAAGSGVAT